MELRRMIFEQKQPMVVVCKSGRAMIALNEQVVKTMENMPTGMTEDGEMRYEERENEQYAYDVCWIDGVSSEADVLQRAKEAVFAAIEAYDKSSAVNGFYLNGMLIPWSKDDPSSPNVDKRMGLRQNIADKVALGEENISIWMKGMSFTMPCAQAEMLMRSIENYAYECFNVTAAHKVAVSRLTSIEEVEKYDITAGYPEQLKMEVSL